MTSIEVKNFAQIREAKISFGDLTVLVGPQASGKSLMLQWLKMAVDAGEVVNALREAGDDVSTSESIMDVVFGQGMSAAWVDMSSVVFDKRSVNPKLWIRKANWVYKTSVVIPKRSVNPKLWIRKRDTTGRIFFIPAHRALLLAEGWPAPFQKLNADTPAVARLFSQNLYQRFSGGQEKALFPIDKFLKAAYRDLINDAVFHGGKVKLQKDGLRYRLRLSFDEKKENEGLPFMTWSSGQREFTPLLLGLYHLLPSTKKRKHPDIEWVVIEEPEMGLHPHAIAVVMLLVLDLLWRGYKVVISTHSPLVLDMVWAIRNIKASDKRAKSAKLLCKAFGVKSTATINQVMDTALTLDYRCYYLKLGADFKVDACDISTLDPGSESNDISGWGGLTGFSSRFGEAVSEAICKD